MPRRTGLLDDGQLRAQAVGGKSGATMPSQCTHLDQIRDVAPRTPQGCEECLATGSKWVHLRLCLICGHVGCCDSSPGKHATKHFHATGHPVIRSFEPGEDWGWCYVDQLFLEPAPHAR
jgi:hypothetical protein